VPPRYRALVLALADTGARPGELIALRVKNLNGSIRIVETTTEVHGKGQATGTPKTRNSIRTVPMTPRCVPRSGITSTRATPTGLTLSPSCSPQRMAPRFGSRTYEARAVVPAAERVGIGPMTTYDLRHSRIPLWLSRGMSPWDVSKLTGTSVQMIEKTYGHAIQSDLQEKIDRLGAEA
jgi:integrase